MHNLFENLTVNYPKTPILAIAPIWRADSSEKRRFGDFSKVAKEINIISNRNKNIHFIDGIDFIPHKKEYYRDGYLHPNDCGFNHYITNLKKHITIIADLKND